MTTFAELVEAELERSPLIVDRQLIYSEQPLRKGGYAFVLVTLRNTSPYELRNVVLTVSESGVAHIEFVSFFDPSWDGNGAFIASIAPGESVDWTLCAAMRAYRATEEPIMLSLHYAVDLVPHGRRHLDFSSLSIGG